MNEHKIMNEGSHTIRVLDYLSTLEHRDINKLMELCCRQDGINLKLELDYKLHLSGLVAEKSQVKSSEMNEFLYYIDEQLVAYLGISCFDGKTGELCGMTHPDYRGRGIFSRLLSLAQNECLHRTYVALLILADGNSVTGMRYLNTVGKAYDHSEYRMKRETSETTKSVTDRETSMDENRATTSNSNVMPVTLRLACKEDELEIAKQNALYFNDAECDAVTGELLVKPLEEEPENCKTYLVMLENTAIGKINVEYGENYAFLCGFGIRPEYRGKGYGRAALTETLNMLETEHIALTELDVVCTNRNALGLYKSCGFNEVSVMNYHSLTI